MEVAGTGGLTFIVGCCESLQSHPSLQAGSYPGGLGKVTGRIWLPNRDQSGSRCAAKGSQGKEITGGPGLCCQNKDCQRKHSGGFPAKALTKAELWWQNSTVNRLVLYSRLARVVL